MRKFISSAKFFHVIAIIALGFQMSCSGGADKAATAELQEKAARVKFEADQLASEASEIHRRITDLGNAETNGPEVVERLSAKEKEVAAEQSRLTTLKADLEAANLKLSSEKSEFARKFGKP